jgi:hypothetical protein
VPWPVFAFGAAPVGLLIGAIAAGIVLFLRYRRNSRDFGNPPAGGTSPVAAAYAASTAGAPGENDGDGDDYEKHRCAIARAWAVGLLVDDADTATALAVGGSLVLVLGEPEPRLDEEYLRDHIDQPCLDPPVLVPDANPSPPPTHRHSQFWPDPRTAEVGEYLVELLRT